MAQSHWRGSSAKNSGWHITWQTETYYQQPSAPYWRATQPSYAVVGLMAR